MQYTRVGQSISDAKSLKSAASSNPKQFLEMEHFQQSCHWGLGRETLSPGRAQILVLPESESWGMKNSALNQAEQGLNPASSPHLSKKNPQSPGF